MNLSDIRLTKKLDIFVSDDLLDDIMKIKISGKYTNPHNIAKVWVYLRYYYQPGESLDSMERSIGLNSDYCSQVIRNLEANSWVEVDRRSKPYIYKVLK